MKLIEKLLEGTTYNNTAAREAMYIVTVSGFNQLQSAVQILAEMAEHKNTGATVKTITDYSTQLFIKEIVLGDQKTNRYQLASIKLIKQRLNAKKMNQKWNDLKTQSRRMPGKVYSVVKYDTALC